MPRYKYTGDRPVAMPEYALDAVLPGQTIEVEQEITNADFKEAAVSTRRRGRPSNSEQDQQSPEEPEAAQTEAAAQEEAPAEADQQEPPKAEE